MRSLVLFSPPFLSSVVTRAVLCCACPCCCPSCLCPAVERRRRRTRRSGRRHTRAAHSNGTTRVAPLCTGPLFPRCLSPPARRSPAFVRPSLRTQHASRTAQGGDHGQNARCTQQHAPGASAARERELRRRANQRPASAAPVSCRACRACAVSLLSSGMCSLVRRRRWTLFPSSAGQSSRQAPRRKQDRGRARMRREERKEEG